MKRLLAVLVVLAVLALLPTAAAHANIKHSEPPAGARLPVAPDSILLVLTQPIDHDTVVLEVTDQDGRRVDTEDITITGLDEPVLSLPLQPGLPDGAYLITLTATSLTDSHRITYTVGFAVGGFLPPSSSQDEAIDGPSAAGRFLGYAGLALVIGALGLGWRLGWAPSLALPMRTGGGLHAVGTLLLLESSRRAVGHDWSAFLDSQIGGLLAWRGVAALILVVAVAAAPQRRAVVGLGALAAVLATARFTHASIAGPLAILNDALHIVAASAWVGGLLVLMWLWRDGSRDARHDAARFSTLALVAVSLLAVTGIMATILILDPALWRGPGLMTGSYAWFLAGKITLAAAMVGVAAFNRYVLLYDPQRDGASMSWLRDLARRSGRPWLRPGHDAGAQPQQGLRRLVGTEAALGAVALVLAGLLLSVSPPDPSASQATGTEGLRVAGAGSDFLVTAFFDPEPVAGGASNMRFFVQYAPDHRDAPGQGVHNDTCGRSGCITVHLTGRNGTIDETRVAEPEGDGWWRVENLIWAGAGSYEATVEVQTEFVFRDDIGLRIDVAGN